MAPKKKISKKRAAKKPVAKKSDTLLQDLLQALAGYYCNDPLTPGVVLAYLPGRARLVLDTETAKPYYGSIARFYRKRLEGSTKTKLVRVVNYKTYGASPDDVITKMAAAWYEEAMRPSKALAPFKLIRGGKK